MWLSVISGLVGFFTVWFLTFEYSKDKLLWIHFRTSRFMMGYSEDTIARNRQSSLVFLFEKDLDCKTYVCLKDFTIEDLRKFLNEDNLKATLVNPNNKSSESYDYIVHTENLRSKLNTINLTKIEKGKHYIIHKDDVFQYVADLIFEAISDMDWPSEYKKILREGRSDDSGKYETNICDKIYLVKLLMYQFVVSVVNVSMEEFYKAAISNDSLRKKHQNYEMLVRLLARNHFWIDLKGIKELHTDPAKKNIHNIFDFCRHSEYDEHFYSFFRDRILKIRQFDLLNRIEIVYVSSYQSVRFSFIDKVINCIFYETVHKNPALE